MTTRCKLHCQEVTKRESGDKAEPFIYDAKFIALADGSEENKKFWKWTPGGSMHLSTVRMQFEAGNDYYIDISEA
jgi:hypothetical protein